MAILWMDGFDYYGASLLLTTRYTFTANSFDNSGTGRFGGKALSNPGGSTSRMTHPLPAPQSSLSMGFAFKYNTGSGSDRVILYLNNNASRICTLFLRGSDKKLVFVRGSSIGSNVLAESANALVNNTWHYIGLEFVRHASTGSIKLYLDGVLEDTEDPANTGASDINSIEIESFSSNAIFMDDYYVVSGSTWLGERKIETLRPSADTAQKDWTPDSGSDNYSRVNETPMNGDTSYVAAATPGDLDLYELANLSGNPDAIDAVQTIVAARKDDSETRTIAPVLLSGSTQEEGDPVATATSYGVGVQVFEQNPDSLAPWDTGGVNALQVGIKVVA